jgi:preprotein translocase subunit SecF
MEFKTFDIVPHGTKFDFVGKRHIAVVLSLIANLAVVLWALPWIHGLNYGVDFAGGTEMEVRVDKSADPAQLRKAVEDLGFKGASVQAYGAASNHSYLIRVERVALLTAPEVEKVAAAAKATIPGYVDYSFNPELGDKIDFQFGEVKDDEAVKTITAALQKAVEGAGVKVSEIRKDRGLAAGSTSFVVITQGVQDRLRAGLQPFAAKDAAGNALDPVQRVEYVGPSVGRELRIQGFKAVLLAMALIVAYVGLRFDFRFSPGVIIALLHDAVITLGYFGFSGREFNLTSIAVILTVVGYSVNDTVVVYDRIRENQGKYKGRSLADIVNLSINEVLGRTFLTSFATALSLIGLLVLGVGTIFDFAMAMLVGIISGTYSTWFIAAPMTIWLEERANKKKAAGTRQVQATPARSAAK